MKLSYFKSNKEKMKVSSKVTLQYLELCRTSSAKCNSFSEIEYKIERHVWLGTVIEIKDGGDTLIVRSYDLDFTLSNNIVISMKRDRLKGTYFISEKQKNTYDKLFGGVTV
ncbi:hypothetical protein ACU063_06565 [Paenibacillus sp. M.A.Huq-81]